MSLAEASEARKARLTALRKRKAGETVDEEGYVSIIPIHLQNVFAKLVFFIFNFRKAEPLIKNRNFDPDSRTLRKHANDDAVMQDTVEVQVKGLAEQIIAEDEKLRAQELVRITISSDFYFIVCYIVNQSIGCV